jgi:archaeal preflagellin peptidase FlaK
VARDRVWVSPGIPFLVPILIGLLIGLTYGDPLIAALVASGLA